jgi:carbon-monoxide dehydrogenase medium subunit
VIGIRVSKLSSGWGYWYEKFRATAQAWAIVGVAALAHRSNGHVAEARIGLTNMGATPRCASAAEQAVAGGAAGRAALHQPPSSPRAAPARRPT